MRRDLMPTERDALMALGTALVRRLLGTDAGRLRRALRVLVLIYCFSYPIAVTGVAFNVHPPFSMAWAGSLMLFLQGVILILWTIIRYGRVRGLAAALWVAIPSFAAELIGVQTGWPFGVYRYTGVLFPMMPGTVPLAVVFAWLLVMLTAGPVATLLLCPIRSHCARWALTAPLAALLAVVLDLLIEPVAVHIEGYWTWRDGGLYYGIPISNFIAWFVVALILATGMRLILSCYERMAPHSVSAEEENGFSADGHRGNSGLDRRPMYPSGFNPRNPAGMPLLMYTSSMFMFTLVDATHWFFGPTALGILTLAAILAVARRRLRSAQSRLPQRHTSAPSTRHIPPLHERLPQRALSAGDSSESH
jgi:uncharacterized membrane protein